MKFLGAPSSGSNAGTTWSHNRFGQYTRNRTTPVNPNSTPQGIVRARLSANASSWRALTDLQRAGWESLGNSMTRTDALGSSYTLTGFLAFCSVNNNLALMGNSLLDDAPALSTPDTILTCTVTLTAASLSIAYTPTPMPTGARIATFASPQRSAGRAFEADLRFIQVSAAAAASPVDAFAAYSAKLGTPVVGNRIFFAMVSMFNGFESGPFRTSKVVA